jgi:23S rRNA (uracil1939-C5)-methyltransferase
MNLPLSSNNDTPSVETMAEPIVEVLFHGLATGGTVVGEVMNTCHEVDASLKGMKAFVPYALPQEHALVRITRREERYLEGEVVKITYSSAERVKSECEYYEACGGCQLQHATYSSQLTFKDEMLRSALEVGHLKDEAKLVVSIREVKPFGYRRRLALGLNRKGHIGLHKRKSHDIIPVRKCLIASEPLNDALKKLNAFEGEIQGTRGTLHLESDETQVLATLKLEKKRTLEQRLHAEAIMRSLFQHGRVEECGVQVSVFGEQSLTLSLGGSPIEKLRVPGGSFSQTNWEVNRLLVDQVLNHVASIAPSTAHDLYSGAGNFALPLALRGIATHAVECDRSLVTLGLEQAKVFGVESTLSFTRASVEKFIAKYDQSQKIDCVIADPPRSGLNEVARYLGYASHLIFISCHLPSFVRDLKILKEEGWTVKTITPFDMFPQTTHLEILAVLVKQ